MAAWRARWSGCVEEVAKSRGSSEEQGKWCGPIELELLPGGIRISTPSPSSSRKMKARAVLGHEFEVRAAELLPSSPRSVMPRSAHGDDE
jgi:hypothetical protein